MTVSLEGQTTVTDIYESATLALHGIHRDLFEHLDCEPFNEAEHFTDALDMRGFIGLEVATTHSTLVTGTKNDGREVWKFLIEPINEDELASDDTPAAVSPIRHCLNTEVRDTANGVTSSMSIAFECENGVEVLITGLEVTNTLANATMKLTLDIYDDFEFSVMGSEDWYGGLDTPQDLTADAIAPEGEAA